MDQIRSELGNHLISYSPKGVSSIISTGKMVFIGFLIVIGLILFALVSDHQKAIQDMIDNPPSVSAPTIPTDNPLDDWLFNRDGDHGIVDEYQIDVYNNQFAPSSVVRDIVDVAKNKPKDQYRNMGYDGSTADALEDIRRQVDVMSCQELARTFTDNPGWSLRSYVAHSFLEKCG